MGGFHLFERGSTQDTSNVEPISHEDDTPLHPLGATHFCRDNPLHPGATHFCRDKPLDPFGAPRSCGDNPLDVDFSSFTLPTETEIEDKGKSDWLAKSLVLFQTSWFVMQCIARAVEHLPITHFEIVTLAYAAMNFVIYFFWWNKPLNVNRPVRVFRKSDVRELTSGEPTSEEPRSSSKNFLDNIKNKPLNVNQPIRVFRKPNVVVPGPEAPSLASR